MDARPILLMLLIAGTVCAEINVDVFYAMRDAICAMYGGIVQMTGAIASLILVWAGVKWIASQDDPSERKKARELVEHVVIGMIIILCAIGIVSIITTQIVCV